MPIIIDKVESSSAKLGGHVMAAGISPLRLCAKPAVALLALFRAVAATSATAPTDTPKNEAEIAQSSSRARVSSNQSGKERKMSRKEKKKKREAVSVDFSCS